MQGVANRARRDVQFEVGQQVWLSTKHLPLRGATRKLSALWAGPFEVAARVTQQAYRLKLPSSWKIHDVFHTSQLKAVHGTVQREEQIELDGQSQAEFEVERILDVRIDRHGHRDFLVAWKGFDSFENSWEPEENMGNCRDLVRAFLVSQPGSAKTRRGSGVRP